jgi:hypothetical protein
VYRPQAALGPPPPVFVPRGAQAPLQLNPAHAGGAPPVYRPQRTTDFAPPPVFVARAAGAPLQLTPAHRGGAPPVYRPGAAAAPAQMRRAPALAPATIQRKIPAKDAERILTAILTYHRRTNLMSELRSRVREIAEMADTTEENCKQRLLDDAQVGPALRALRMDAPSPNSKVQPTGDKKRVYEAVLEATFYHVAPGAVAATIRGTGVDPDKGGNDTGISATRAVNGQAEQLKKESEHKAYVARSMDELEQYGKKMEKPAYLRVFLSQAERNALKTDPKSKSGLFSEQRLRHVDNAEGSVPTAVIDMLAQDLKMDRNQVRQFYYELLGDGAFEKRERKFERDEIAFIEERHLIGNCLYDAVNDALGNSEGLANQYRQIATQWFVTHYHNYPDLQAVGDPTEVVDILSTPGRWDADAGDLAPLILASALGATIEVVTAHNRFVYAPLGNGSVRSVTVFYHLQHYTDIPLAAHQGWEQRPQKSLTAKKKV